MAVAIYKVKWHHQGLHNCKHNYTAVTLSCTLQHKRYGSDNGGWSPYYFISPDLPPIHALQILLDAFHTWTHLPWFEGSSNILWAVIIGCTAVLRSMITLPLAIHQNKLIAEIELHQPTISMMTEALKHRVVGECQRSGVSADKADKLFKKRHRKMIYDYYQSEGCNPLKIYILPWIQMPLWFFLSLSLRNLTGFFPSQRNSGGDMILPCPEIANEGALWFADLTVPDPTLIIPFAVGVFNLANIELNALRRQKPTKTQQIVTNSLRIVTPSESEYPIRDLQNLARLKREEFLQIQREGRPVKKGK
ncbi:Cytochrome c oxidase assembly protein COX18 [Acropora cervicornis]|uniref:Cytochrome c oxidase assembly protein COX18 n=1 Tax=Acropora cervicornis TaxID=6130 RepID=A0AAD9QVV7_ACRCE|nr:Cytochrome c oxidase assembly protein COX18 [Acropora cervicornis]